MAKKTPFHEINLEHGATMREMFGYFLPWEYREGQVEEHLGTRQRASLCDLDYMGEFTIEGADALELLQKLGTNDFARQAVGAHRYTALCDADGNMMDDCTVWRLGEQKWMIISGDEADFEWITKNAEGLDVNLQNITAQHTTLALEGPTAQEIMAKVTDVDLASIAYYHFARGKVAGVDSLVARMGYTGENGFEAHFHPRHARTVWSAIMQAGKPFHIVPCGQAALESLRQEAGYILVGNEHDKSTNPFEAGIGWTVKFEKKDFNGKRALAAILKKGLKRHLVWFRLPGSEVAAKGDAIFSGNKQIGQVTSGSYSPTFKAGTALGYVAPAFAIPGATFQIEIDGARCPARLSTMPLYDPGNWLTKGKP